MEATTWRVSIFRDSSIVFDTHGALGEVGDYKSECTSWNIEVREDGHYHIVVHPVEGLAEVNQATYNSSWIFAPIIKILLDKIQHLY